MNAPRWRQPSFLWISAALLLIFLRQATALDPGRAISQYIHDTWREEEGFPGGSVNAIAEADGYLWVGAEKGLVRFDGKSFRLFNSDNTAGFSPGPALGVIADGEGGLWIRLQSPNLLRYHDGKFTAIPLPDPAQRFITAMSKGLDGGLILWRPGGPLSYRGGKVDEIAGSSSRAKALALSIAQTADGAIWLGTSTAGLVRLQDGRETSFPETEENKISCLLADGGAQVWVGGDAGLFRWNGREITRDGVPPPLRRGPALALARDRDSNVWVGTSSSLFRIDPSGSFAERRDPKAGPVSALFEDRNGDLWLGGTHGLERYREGVFLTYSMAGGRLENGGPLYVDSSGRTWMGPAGGGLAWLNGGEMKWFHGAGLDQDVVYSIDGAAREVWIGRRSGGLTLLRVQGGSFSPEVYTAAHGLAPGGIYAVHRNRDGSVWAGSLGGGVSRVQGGRITTYTASSGLASNTVYAIEEGADGTTWFATSNGLSAFAQGRWRSLASREGLPPGRIHCLTEDTAGILWICTDAGPAFLREGRIQTPRQLPDSLLREVFEIADDGRGSLWIASAKGIVRVPRSYLLGEAQGPGALREFLSAEGIPQTGGVRRHRSMVTDRAGRIWFSARGGVSVVDPARLLRESVPAIVHIQEIAADGNPVSLAASPRVPAGGRRVTFGFDGLSLTAPDRVRFRYRLDGFDRDWSELAATRQAVYTNLAPGSYRFRVRASDTEGLWHSSEAAVAFEVLPLFWQTWWFRVSGVLVVVLLAAAVHRLRVRQVTNQLKVRFEERLVERTRIAQDLHDTLLQGLMGASMQLYVATSEVPEEIPARTKLNKVLAQVQGVVEEGRRAVSGLRSERAGDDLEEAFAHIAQEEHAAETTDYRVVIEGGRRPVNTLVRDEIYRIGREAIVNAFRHAKASHVEVNIEYLPGGLRLLVRDDGCGIDPDVVTTGRDGHWGLVGMRERAIRVNGRLHVRSRPGEGTEVELTVPGKIAFPRIGRAESKSRRLTAFLRGRFGSADGRPGK